MLNIVKNKLIFFIISGVLMLASIVSLALQGFNLDTDFAGGIALTLKLEKTFQVKDVEAKVSEALGATQKASSVQASENNEVIIKFAYNNALKTDAERTAFQNEKIDAIKTKLTESYGKVEEIGSDIVSPSTGRELAMSAIWMSLLAALAILIYVTFRFEFTSGVCAIIALVHDILILCGIYSICRIAIDTNYIAALLTVLGYSINATIVIFDRIRENTRHANKESYGEITNKSINQTMLRSINTTITTLLTIGMVYLLGVTSIKVFALPIIIGILIGTYSSICIAGNVWATWKDAAVNAKAKAKANAKK